MHPISKFPQIVYRLYLFSFLLHLGSTTQLVCPSHCDCYFEDNLPSLKCDQLPQLDKATALINILRIENSNSYTCSVSENLSKFPQLKKFYISHCSVNININSFKKLPNLDSITFHNVSLNHINPTIFESNRYLRTVNLSSNPLRIGRHLLISASIEAVDLTNCHLNYIPSSAFTQILNLKKLNLSANDLKSFKISLPSTMTYLDLSENQLEGIPLRIILPLENLNTLNVLGNPLICSCDLKILQKYLSLRNVKFLRPDTCLLTTNKTFIPLEDISVEDLCMSATSSFLRSRRWINLGHRAHLETSTEAETSETDTSTSKYNIKVNNPLTNEFIDLNEEIDFQIENLLNNEEPTEEPAEEPNENQSPVSKTTLYVLIGIIFILLILLIIILVALCLALKHRNDDGDSVAAECAAQVCESACKSETKKLMNKTCRNQKSQQLTAATTRCSSRKGTTCRICPSTMSRKKSAMSDLSCKSASTGASCKYTAANSEAYSDTETVTNDNDCDFSAAESATSSACTTFQRR